MPAIRLPPADQHHPVRDRQEHGFRAQIAGDGAIEVAHADGVGIGARRPIDLGTEQYDLALKSRSKQFSLFALRGPILVGGSLRDPTVGPSVAPVAMRVGVAAGLAAIPPLLAILPFIDLGGAEDVDCRRVLGAPDNASVPSKNDGASAGATAPPVAEDARVAAGRRQGK